MLRLVVVAVIVVLTAQNARAIPSWGPWLELDDKYAPIELSGPFESHEEFCRSLHADYAEKNMMCEWAETRLPAPPPPVIEARLLHAGFSAPTRIGIRIKSGWFFSEQSFRFSDRVAPIVEQFSAEPSAAAAIVALRVQEYRWYALSMERGAWSCYRYVIVCPIGLDETPACFPQLPLAWRHRCAAEDDVPYWVDAMPSLRKHAWDWELTATIRGTILDVRGKQTTKIPAKVRGFLGARALR